MKQPRHRQDFCFQQYRQDIQLTRCWVNKSDSGCLALEKIPTVQLCEWKPHDLVDIIQRVIRLLMIIQGLR